MVVLSALPMPHSPAALATPRRLPPIRRASFPRVPFYCTVPPSLCVLVSLVTAKYHWHRITPAPAYCPFGSLPFCLFPFRFPIQHSGPRFNPFLFTRFSNINRSPIPYPLHKLMMERVVEEMKRLHVPEEVFVRNQRKPLNQQKSDAGFSPLHQIKYYDIR